MEPYAQNRNCSCFRCRIRNLMGAAVIITIGVLLLLDRNGPLEFHQSWPVILLVIGVFLFLGRSASTEGHVQPYGIAAAPPAADAWSAGTAAPPPPPPPAPQPNSNDTQVKS